MRKTKDLWTLIFVNIIEKDDKGMPKLKIILLSATISVDTFINFSKTIDTVTH